MSSSWFDVDKEGLANLLARKGKAWAVFELVQNAFDANASNVTIRVGPLPGAPYAKIVVEDDSSEGWPMLEHAFTMFAGSRRASDPTKRGRFNLGEKLVLACSRFAKIETMDGSLTFNDTGRRRGPARRSIGTRVEAEIRMTRDELSELEFAAHKIIPPKGVTLTFNDTIIERDEPIAVFECKLPTEFTAKDGTMRRSVRTAHVEAFDAECGSILELGIPVCEADWPWHLNVQQKVPQGMERDNVTDAFRRALQVAAMNKLADKLNADQAATPWATEAMGDGRATGEAVTTLVKKRFGERAVVAVPGDPVANATAEARGYTVVHGGALPSTAWSNVKKAGVMPTTSATFPTAKPEQQAAAVEALAEALDGKCPMCLQPLPTP